MDINFSTEDLAFRDEVRAFFKEAFSDDLIKMLTENSSVKPGMIEWQKRLYAKGWIAPGWPKEYGGAQWSAMQSFIYETERATAGVPDVIPFGLKMVGPVIYTFGNDEQKQRFLPRILQSEDWWCQGYSEAGAGSDLAALQTKADLDGDDYIINGAKLWTTYAQYADWIFCLVRTDNSGRKQEGISFMLIDMQSPGISVNPIRTIDGKHTLNEVLFDNVRVPVANRIGEQDKGWTYAKALLAHERTAIAEVSESRRKVNALRAQARTEQSNGAAMLQDPVFQARLAAVEIDLMALEYTELRALAATAEGKPPGAESSLLKLKGTDLRQTIDELSMDLAGYYSGAIAGEVGSEQIGHDFADKARDVYMYGRAATIFGGSNEVQRNIIAKYVLGL